MLVRPALGRGWAPIRNPSGRSGASARTNGALERLLTTRFDVKVADLLVQCSPDEHLAKTARSNAQGRVG